MDRKRFMLTDFAMGLIIGFISAVIIFGVMTGFYFYNQKKREELKYAEMQIEIRELREEIINLAPDDIFETMPDVRRAADGAAAEFERKRDEVVERFRSGFVDR